MLGDYDLLSAVEEPIVRPQTVHRENCSTNTQRRRIHHGQVIRVRPRSMTVGLEGG
jgi:hypothetical protein